VSGTKTVVSGRKVPAMRIFAVRDPVVIGRALGIDIASYAIFEVERLPGEAREGILPRGATADEIVARIPNNHFAYALTWFGLAATLIGVYLALVFHLRRERLSSPAPRL
jgi:surfeit locus 1 family protein